MLVVGSLKAIVYEPKRVDREGGGEGGTRGMTLSRGLDGLMGKYELCVTGGKHWSISMQHYS